jgi:predicted transcriptional regulator
LAVPAKKANKGRKVDPGRLAKMKAGGMTQSEIAETMGVCKQAVSQAVKRFQLAPDLNVFQLGKAEIFENLQAEIVESIDRDSIKAANLQQRGTVIGILEDKIRVIRGQETSIDRVDIRMLIAQLPINTANDL